VRDWMGIVEPVQRPAREHPKRRIDGFACRRSEVSGRRLWAWAASRIGTASEFFEDWFVINYCPLVFLEASGRNLTPDALPAGPRRALIEACDRHLVEALSALDPEWAIGVGGFAEQRLRAVLQDRTAGDDRLSAIKVSRILHPSPVNPAANRGWAEAVDRTFAQLGVWPRARGAAA